jgi:hypothetical protein
MGTVNALDRLKKSPGPAGPGLGSVRNREATLTPLIVRPSWRLASDSKGEG